MVLQQPRMEKLLELDGDANAKCAHCGIAGAKYACSCELEHYCGSECQKKHWAKHNEVCPVFLSQVVEKAKMEHGSDSAELARCQMCAGFALGNHHRETESEQYFLEAEQYFLDAARIYTAMVASYLATAVGDDSPTVSDETEREGAAEGDSGECPRCIGDLAMALFSLGNLYVYQEGRLDEALEMYQKSLEAIKGKDAELCKRTRVWDLRGIGIVLNKQDKNSEALEKYEEAYSISVEVNGPEHGETVMVLDGMSRSHAKLGNKDRAIELMEKGIDIQRRILGGDSLQLAESLENTGEAILMLHDASKALEMFEESVHISVRALGSVNHEKVADIVASIACCKGCLGDNAEATMFLREACRIYDHLGIQNYKSRSAAEQLLRVQMIQLMSLVS